MDNELESKITSYILSGDGYVKIATLLGISTKKVSRVAVKYNLYDMITLEYNINAIDIVKTYLNNIFNYILENDTFQLITENNLTTVISKTGTTSKIKLTYAANELLSIGKGFAFDKTTTNADVAYRDRWGVGQKRLDENPSDPHLNVNGDAAPLTRDFDKDNQVRKSISDELTNINRGFEDVAKAKEWVKTHKKGENPRYDALAEVSDLTLDGWKGKKYMLEQKQRELDGFLSNATAKAYTAMDKNIDPKYVNELGEFKYKFNPFEFGLSGGQGSDALKAIDDKFNKTYQTILSSQPEYVWKATGTNIIGENIDWDRSISTINDLNKAYTDGINTIAAIRKQYGSKMTDEEKQSLDFYEQKYRINSSRIFSKIPEQVYKKESATRGITGGGSTTYNSTPFNGKETFDKAVRDNYSDNGSWAPMAVARGDADYTVLMNPDGSIQPKSLRAVKQLEDVISGNPTNHTVMIGDKHIEPGDEGYPIPGTIKIISTNVDKVGGSATPIVSAQYEYWGTKKVPVYDTDKITITGYQDERTKLVGNCTIIADGASSQEFNQRYAREMQSDMNKNPSDPQNIYRYADMIRLDDPKLASDLTEIARLKKGEQANLEIGNNPDDLNSASIQVWQNSNNDSWTVKYIDPATGVSKSKTNLPNIAAVQQFYVTELYTK